MAVHTGEVRVANRQPAHPQGESDVHTHCRLTWVKRLTDHCPSDIHVHTTPLVCHWALSNFQQNYQHGTFKPESQGLGVLGMFICCH